MIEQAIDLVVRGHDLEGATMEAAMGAILEGQVSDAQIAALAVALRMKGETREELAAAARAMRAHCAAVRSPGPLLDTCGTGGDGVGTFNISTVSAFVVAATGVRVAKHGNRAVSSKAGSADVLEALGGRTDLSPERARECLEAVGFGFFFAPTHHAALRHAAAVRRQLRLRTFFNLLGPLSNPAGATHQVVGVYDPRRVRVMAEVLGELGVEAAWVVHGHGGLDEVSPSGPTQVAMLAKGRVEERTVHPQDFGLSPVPLESLVGGDAHANAAIARQILSGQRGPARDVVLLNAAAALLVAGKAHELAEAAALAASAIDSGAARDTLAAWVRFVTS